MCDIYDFDSYISYGGVYARERARGGSARNQGKASILVQRHSIPGQSLPAGSAVPL